MIDLQSLLKPVFGDLPHTHDAAGVVGEHINTWAHGPQPLGQRADLVQPGEVGAQVGSVQSAGALRRLGFGAADEDQAVALAGELARRGGADAVAGSGDDYGALGHRLPTLSRAWAPVAVRPVDDGKGDTLSGVLVRETTRGPPLVLASWGTRV